jgi:mannose-6-phosphate isomerase-like protein (cupin superfamily)
VGKVFLLDRIEGFGRSFKSSEDRALRFPTAMSGLCRGKSVARTLWPNVEQRNLKRFVHFSADGVRRETVFETDRVWTQVLCFERNQGIGPLIDPDADGVFLVVAGEAVFLVDGQRKRLDQWGTVLVPAGAEVSVTNASVDPLVVFLMTAPPPAADPVTG